MVATEDWGPQIQAVTITMLSICLVSTALRCYVRSNVVMQAFGLDDWLMLLAMALYIVFAAMAITSVHYGLGRHEVDLTAEELVNFKLYWWLCELAYGPSITVSRFSIGVLFLRLTIERRHRYLIYFVLVSSAVVGVVFVFLFVFQCRPVSYYWDTNQDGTCLDATVVVDLTYLSSVPSILCDSYYAILPVFLIRKLQMDRSTKMALGFILGLGCFASIAIIVRFPFLHYIAEPDFSWNAAKAGIWNFVEPGLAITAGNLAVVRPIFRKILQVLGLRTSSTEPKLQISNQSCPPTIGTKEGRRSADDTLDLLTYPERTTTRSTDERNSIKKPPEIYSRTQNNV